MTGLSWADGMCTSAPFLPHYDLWGKVEFKHKDCPTPKSSQKSVPKQTYKWGFFKETLFAVKTRGHFGKLFFFLYNFWYMALVPHRAEHAIIDNFSSASLFEFTSEGWETTTEKESLDKSGILSIEQFLREASQVEWPNMLTLWKTVESPRTLVVLWTIPDTPELSLGVPMPWSVALRAAGTRRQGSARFLREGYNIPRLKPTCPMLPPPPPKVKTCWKTRKLFPSGWEDKEVTKTVKGIRREI